MGIGQCSGRGCNSDTLGLSNTLSDVIESVANTVTDPFESVTSEDMLRRVTSCNNELEKMKREKGEHWKWKYEIILIGTDVKSLFLSLSANLTGKAAREQFSKSTITWENVNWDLITLYIMLQENYWEFGELSAVRRYLPIRILKWEGLDPLEQWVWKINSNGLTKVISSH